MKKTFLILAVLLCGCFALKAQQNYDFADNSTGQTIYYRITDAGQHTVSIVPPRNDYSLSWDGFTKPVGEITLPENFTHDGISYTVTGIGDNAFVNCDELTGQLVIPESVTSIGISAFYGCKGFTGPLTIPNSVKTIGQEAFEFCEGLSGRLMIGSSIENIGMWAFSHTGFSYAGIRATSTPRFGSEQFRQTPIQAIAVPEGCADAYKTALSEYADKITGIVLQEHCLFVSSFNEDFGLASMTSHEGSHVTVTAQPNGNRWFVNWTENGEYVTASNPYEFDLDRDRLLVANFGSYYDFTDNSTGQTLYYRITDAEQRFVRLVAPNGDNSNGWNGFTKPTGGITLPETVRHNSKDYTVTEIGDFALYKCEGLTGSLNIPNTVTSIGRSAFEDCSGMEGTLTLGNSIVSIGHDAFKNCKFTGQLVLPESVETIDIAAFYGCKGFTGTLVIPNSVKTIKDNAFQECSGFTGSLVIPNSVTSIGNHAFYNCSGFIGTLTLGESLESIYYDAFNKCYGLLEVINLSGLEIVIGSTDNGYAAYYALSVVTDPNESKLKEEDDFVFFIEEANYLVGYKGNATQLTLPESFRGGNYVIYKNVFRDRTNFTGSLIIPNSVTSIEESAFEGCSGMKGTLTLGNSIVSIAQNAFKNCGFTGSLIIPNSVTSIGETAFAGCTGFTGSLTIGNSVTSIGKEAFLNCSGLLGSLTIGNSVESIGDKAFYECTKLFEVINLSNLDIVIGATTHGYAAYYALSVVTDPSESGLAEEGDFVFLTVEGTNYLVSYKGNDTQLTLPESFHDENYVIYKNVFRNCSDFTGSLVIPNSVTSIGEEAFYQCYGLNGSLTIGSSVESIGPRAFFECSRFTGPLVIPNSVTSIGGEAFESCHGFTSLTIGTSVESIGEGAFYDCSGFTGSLVIPNSVKSIGISAFADCSGFTGSLTIGTSVESIPDGAFYECSRFTGSLTIPNSVESIGEEAFAGCSGFTGSLTIGNSVASIGVVAFAECLGFTSLIIGTSVESIGEGAFYECSGFVGSLIIPEKVTSIGGFAFEGCVKLFEIINLSNLDIVKGATTHGYVAYYALSVKDSGPASDIVDYGDFVFLISEGNNYLVDYKGNATQLILPDSYEGQNYAIGNYVFPGRDNFTGSLIIPETVTGIGDYAFADCPFNGTLTIGNSVKSIGNGAFSWCSGFTGSLVIPNSVESIGEGAFKSCSGFTGSLIIPNSVKSIGERAFEYCEGLTGSLTIGDNVTSIGEYAFNLCYGFTGTLTIGSSVESIGEYAFFDCFRLVEVINRSSLDIVKGSDGHGMAARYALKVKDSGPSELVNYGDFIFFPLVEGTNYLIAYTGNDAQLTLPDSYNGGNYVINQGAFYYRGDLKGALIIPETVTRIENFAFFACSGFTGLLTIPNSVTSIGGSAFNGCSHFTGSLTIGSSVESIGQNAFWNCNFDNIISKAQNAPSLASRIPDTTSEVYIPAGRTESYESAWTGYGYNFIEYDGEFYHFNGASATDNKWSTASNWEEGVVPTQNSPIVFINADCQVDVEVEVGLVTVAANKTFTVNQDCTLTADGITLEDAAQLVNNGSLACSNYTIMKDITGYGTSEGNWYLISSPVDKNDFYWIPGILTIPEDTYDLYRFEQAGDEEGNEWINRKFVEEVYDVEFVLENQRGYLYANKNGTTILFRGGLAATGAKTLEYVEGVDFAGFNLVGNPYPCNAYLADGRSFYRMNGSGTGLIVENKNPTIAPCEGVFVQAQSTGESLTFTSTAPSTTCSLPAATVAFTLSQGRSAAAIDRAIVRLGEGDVLGKLMLNADGTRLYIPQDGKDFAVVSTGSTGCGEMPLNFKAAKNGTYTISVNSENVDAEYLHLIDNLTGNDVDLLGSEGDVARNVSTYTFDAKTDDYASRFKLVFGVKDEASAGSAGDFAYISNGEIVISNDGRATLQVIDVMGRIVSSEEINGNCRISTSTLTAGLYILNLNGMTQKIVIE